VKINSSSGFKEIDHIADVALQIWAPDLPELFIQAAKGLFMLMRCDSVPEKLPIRKLSLRENGLENLLVRFLNELLHFAEDKRVAYYPIEMRLNEPSLYSRMKGRKIVNVRRELKATTYHQLKIKHYRFGYQVVITFDV